MGSLRIKGVVAFTDRLRRELAAPITVARRIELGMELSDVIRQIDGILARYRVRADGLPSPTRRAYQFLTQLDLDKVAVAAEAEATPTESEQRANEDGRSGVSGDIPRAHQRSGSRGFRLVGVTAYWRRILFRLAVATEGTEREELRDSIDQANHNIAQYLEEENAAPADMTDQSRAVRAWLLYFSEGVNFDAYMSAIDRARPCLEAVMRRGGGFRPPARLEFRPISGMYKLRGNRDGTRVILPTPMIAFSSEQFIMLAEAAFGSGDRQCVIAATATEAYQEIQTKWEALEGVESRAAGVHRDLAASFDRVNRRYFDGRSGRPRLMWSRSSLGRKFGHYDFLHDTMMISCLLDSVQIPTFVLDFVVYHELLHKRLGVDWRNGRAHAHTPEFRKQERRFDRYDEAEIALQRLAGGAVYIEE